MSHRPDHVLVAELCGPDLSYWVARANTKGSAQESSVLYGQYACCRVTDSQLEDCMRQFVQNRLGAVLPPRVFWH